MKYKKPEKQKTTKLKILKLTNQQIKERSENKMITVIAIFSIIITLVASELYLVYKNYKEGIAIKNMRNDIKNLNYSSR